MFKDRQESVPIKLTTLDIEDFSRSHIEVLHVLHNEVQKDCFGHSDPDDPAYDYRRAEKRIEWDRVFSGA